MASNFNPNDDSYLLPDHIDHNVFVFLVTYHYFLVFCHCPQVFVFDVP